MKRIKRMFIAFILLSLCSGCTINYNLEITSDTVKETIKITDTITNDRNKTDILKVYNRWIPAYIDSINGNGKGYDSSIKNEDFEYHKKNIKELDNGYYYTYEYDYPIYKYNDAVATREAYIKRNFYKGNDYIMINTSDENLLCNYSYFESLKVTISIDEDIYKLNYTNADTKKNNTYTWNIDRNNCNNSQILLKLDIIKNNNNVINKDDNNNKEQNNNNITINNQSNNYPLYIFFAILIVAFFLGYNWFNNLKSKNNDIY